MAGAAARAQAAQAAASAVLPPLPSQASDASGTGLYDTAARAWDQRRIAQLDPRLGSCLPGLIGPDEVKAEGRRRSGAPGAGMWRPGSTAQGTLQAYPLSCSSTLSTPPPTTLAPQAVGTLRQEVAAELGLPHDVVVSAGGGDNAMAALGAGMVREGSVIVSLGTSGEPRACVWIVARPVCQRCACRGARELMHRGRVPLGPQARCLAPAASPSWTPLARSARLRMPQASGCRCCARSTRPG